MPRDYRVSLEDMVGSLARIRTLTSGMSYNEFVEDLTRQEAVFRNLEIIGVASKSVPHEVRSSYPEVDWARIGGLRDVLIHHYFGIDEDAVWSVIEKDIPELKFNIEAILKSLEE